MSYFRKYLNSDGLLKIIRYGLQKESFRRCRVGSYRWEDCIMTGLAVFGLKFPSLLQFEKMKAQAPMVRRNLRTLYGVWHAPSDTCLRERLDELLPQQLRGGFKRLFAYLQRGKVLEPFRYLDGHYLISIDGTGQYSSDTVHCQNCCEKIYRDGHKTYYHHMLGAVLVHPDKKVVIPFAPEPITKADGKTKNDGEQQASKRLLADLRREHPHLKMLIIQDSLAATYPHLSLLNAYNMAYIIGVKPGSHAYL